MRRQWLNANRNKKEKREAILTGSHVCESGRSRSRSRTTPSMTSAACWGSSRAWPSTWAPSLTGELVASLRCRTKVDQDCVIFSAIEGLGLDGDGTSLLLLLLTNCLIIVLAKHFRQNEALDHLQGDVDELNSRVKGANQRARKLAAK